MHRGNFKIPHRKATLGRPRDQTGDPIAVRRPQQTNHEASILPILSLCPRQHSDLQYDAKIKLLLFMYLKKVPMPDIYKWELKHLRSTGDFEQ